MTIHEHSAGGFRRRLLQGGASALLAAAVLGGFPAMADESWPSRSITMIHGFSTGGGVDTTARILAHRMSELLGQPVVVESRSGGSTTIAAQYLAQQPADGYTIALISSSHAIAPALYPGIQYDPVGSFTLLSQVASAPTVIFAGKDEPSLTIGEVVERAKAAPGSLNYGAGGIGTSFHLTALLLEEGLGLSMTHVPYRGGNDTRLALLSGEIDLQFGSLGPADDVLALAVTTAERFPTLPDVPTIGETVLPGFEAVAWYGLAAPAGLPDAVALKLGAAVRDILGEKATGDALLRIGLLATPDSEREHFTAFVAEELERWGRLVEENDLDSLQ